MSEPFDTDALPAQPTQARGVRSNGLLFLSGFSPDPLRHRHASVVREGEPLATSADVAAVVDDLRAALATRDLGLEHLVRVEVSLRDVSQVAEFTQTWRAVVGEHVPTTLLIAGPNGLLSAGASLEIDVVVAEDGSTPERAAWHAADGSDGEVAATVAGGGMIFLAAKLPVAPGSVVLADEVRADPLRPFDVDAVEAQTDYALADLSATLESLGSDLDHVVKAQVFLDDLADFHVFDQVWATYFGSTPPPRTTVGVEALPVPGALVSIQLTAVRRGSGLEVRDVVTDDAPAPIANYTQARRGGGLVFAAGQLASDFVDGVPKKAGINPAFPFYGRTIEAQTRFVLGNIDTVLAAGGSSLARTVKATILLRDLHEFSGFDRAWRERFGDDAPARTTFELGGAGLLPDGPRVEIYVISEVD